MRIGRRDWRIGIGLRPELVNGNWEVGKKWRIGVGIRQFCYLVATPNWNWNSNSIQAEMPYN
jgi:hypothetical protein